MSLHKEAEEGNKKALQQILASGVEVNLVDGKGQTALHYAAAAGNVDCVTLLLDKGANPNIRNGHQQTPLIHAAKNNKTNVVSTLLELSANIGLKDTNNNTALHHALQGGNNRCALLLIEHTTDANILNIENSDGVTPLHAAAKKGLTDSMVALIEKGAKIDAKDKKGNTPLGLLSIRDRDSPYSPPWSLRAHKVCNDLRDLVNNSEFSDIEFVVEGQHIYAHRNILSRRYPHFFKSVVTDETTNKPIVALNDLRKVTFLGVLEFAYTGGLDDFISKLAATKSSTEDPLELAVELVSFADTHQLEDLKAFSEGVVADFVDVTNVSRVLQLASATSGGLSRLMGFCQNFIAKNVNALLDKKVFKDMSKNEWIDLVKNVARDVKKEEQVTHTPAASNANGNLSTPARHTAPSSLPPTSTQATSPASVQSPSIAPTTSHKPVTPASQATPKGRNVKSPAGLRMDTTYYKQAMGILKALMKNKNAWPFKDPVDPVALSIPDYFNVIKHPMDFGTIEKNLQQNKYETPYHFQSDMMLVFNNAMTYNHPGSTIYIWADQLREIFNSKWTKVNWGSRPANLPVPVQVPFQSAPPLPAAAPVPPVKKEPPGRPGPAPKATGQKRRDSATPDTTAAATLSAEEKLKKRKVESAPAGQPEQKAHRELSLVEKQRLGDAINSLDANDLTQVVNIINMQKFENSTNQPDSEDIEIDMNDLDPDTLWKLNEFVKQCRKEKGDPFSDDDGEDGDEMAMGENDPTEADAFGEASAMDEDNKK
jgi:hypothetical protein